MKPPGLNSAARRRGGMLLIECLVYMSVFTIVLCAGMGAFYVVWGNSDVVRSTADDISCALRAGEQWRADIRGVTGKIEEKQSPDGPVLQIPHGRDRILYRFSGGAIWRKTASASSWVPVLSRVKSSEMKMENRNQIQTWRWEVELLPRTLKARTRPLFTFEAVSPAKS